MITIHRADLAALCKQALQRSGCGPDSAIILAQATIEAEQAGHRAVGVAHLFDYLDGYRQGRIAAEAQPTVRRAAPAIIDVDADCGLAQVAYEAAFQDFTDAIREAGVAALWIRQSYTCGELGYYARRLAALGLVAVASANSPALMSIGGSPKRVLGTNPLAFGIPRPGTLPLVIDQASSSTAFVNIRSAAEAGGPIPEGWALDNRGNPTTDANEAAEGTLLPFGSHRGGNVALLIEILSTLSGASFSVDAAPFDRGSTSPGIGVFVLGVDPGNFAGSIERLAKQFGALQDDHQVRIPALERTELPDHIDMPPAVLQRLRHAAAS